MNNHREDTVNTGRIGLAATDPVWLEAATTIPDVEKKSIRAQAKIGKQSPAGRFAFGTCRLWKKSDSLVESGLLGPVTIQSAEVIK